MMTRLNYDDILHIYKLISLNESAIEISNKLNIAPSTLYRLIKTNIEVKRLTSNFRHYPFKSCVHLHACRKEIKRCPKVCEHFVKWLCPRLKSFPFFCNFCDEIKHCAKDKHMFDPVQVYIKRQRRLIDSRRRISLSNKDFKSFNQWLSPLIKNGLGIEVLFNEYPDLFPVSTSTVRRWINDGRLSAKRIDLRRAVTYKVKKQYAYKRPPGYDPLVKFGHTYGCFLNHLKINPRASIMEFDTVHGLANEKKKLLTMYHRKTHFQIGILIDDIKENSVNNALVNIQKQLGEAFSSIFEVILADNGFEFDGLMKHSVDKETGQILSHVFYTKPYCSGDKGGCERNHEFFRYFIPKKNSIEHLTQDDINMMFSCINSYPRESLNWRSPIDIFKRIYSVDILNKLGYQKVDVKNINFKMKTT
jgi:IS30 family transposase